MREIKFRAWHEENKTMVNFDNNKLVMDVYQMNHLACLMRGDYGDVLMQFTGLKDVNGADIYEGDIVAMPYIDPMDEIHYQDNFLSDVIFERGCFQVWCNELKPERHNIENWIERTEGEYKSNYGNVNKWGDCVLTVIGNIYENPELIK